MLQLFQLLLPDLGIQLKTHQFGYGENKLMIIGGFSDGQPTNAVYTFDLATGNNEKFVSLNKNRHSHSCIATVMEGTEYVFAAGTALFIIKRRFHI